ncbi:MAG: hypothetical protein WC243_02480 [Patescibacteria group bacterium]|jgi:hypothetical protein
MKKYTYASLVLSILLAIPVVVHAQQGQGSGTGNGDQLRVQDPATHDTDSTIPSGQGNQVQNKNQVNTQNQGEDTQLKVNTNTAEESQFGTGRSEVARQHMSAVSEAVEDFLSTGNKTGGIGKQVSDVAKLQQEAQVEIGETLGKIDNRGGFMRVLLGHNAGAVREMKQLMEQNQLRIQQLQELMTQTVNQGEVTQLRLMIQAMVDQNTALEDQVMVEEQDRGMFGWISALFN